MNLELKHHVESFDNGDKVQTVEMGGISNGYEIAIQELGIELMRNLMDVDIPEDELFNSVFTKNTKDAIDTLNKKYGFSGAQVGAAKNLAAIYWRKTPSVALDMMRDSDPERIISIWKNNEGQIFLSKEMGN